MRKLVLSNGFLALAFALMLTALLLVFIYVPTEEEMGAVQRIFYFHVPLAWIAFLAFFVVFIASLLYLWQRRERWDNLAFSSAEVGFVFTSLVLLTGPIWARPVWGVWWTWDARLTTTLVLWLIYLAYLVVRPLAGEGSRGARFAAVVGIAGFVDVPLVALAIVLWRTQHPGPLVFEGGLSGSMLLTLLVSISAFTTLYLRLLFQAERLREMRGEVERLRWWGEE